ncbi:ArnT family glycosyltransferase [Leifsonia aquatica]|uniref:ArnT family glycosyltransferase n=1 Tax=Leifsonia aquatica TaxID=144185 RepID=UPI0037F3F25A
MIALPDLAMADTAPRTIGFFQRRAVRWSLLAAVFVWGAYQSLWNLLSANPNADEPLYAIVGRQYVAGDASQNHEQPPTAKYLFGVVQLIFGDGLAAPRILVGVLTLLAGLIIFLWLRPELGWVPALIPTAFWLLLPRGVDTTFEFRLDRVAVLEPVMAFFAIAAMAAAWQWHRGRSVLWLVIAAISLGLSATSKPTTAVILPAFLLLIIARRRLKPVVIGLLVSAATLGATVFLVYRQIGLRTGITDLVNFQAAQNAGGHLIDLAGFATGHPPWWANLYFAWQGFGTITTVVLLAGTIAAFFAREHRLLVVYLTLALAPMMVFYLFIAKNALPSYYYAWAWPLCILGGIGVARLLQPGWMAARTIVSRSFGSLLLALALVAAVSTSLLVWNDGPTGFARVDRALRAAGIDHGMVLVSGVAPWEPEQAIGTRATTDPTAHCIVAVATKVSPRSPITPEVKAFIADHRSELHRTMLDNVTFYVFTRSAATANCR